MRLRNTILTRQNETLRTDVKHGSILWLTRSLDHFWSLQSTTNKNVMCKHCSWAAVYGENVYNTTPELTILALLETVCLHNSTVVTWASVVSPSSASYFRFLTNRCMDPVQILWGISTRHIANPFPFKICYFKCLRFISFPLALALPEINF